VPLITLALIVVAALVVHRRRAPITPAEERIP
jgi:hypothetical protein